MHQPSMSFVRLLVVVVLVLTTVQRDVDASPSGRHFQRSSPSSSGRLSSTSSEGGAHLRRVANSTSTGSLLQDDDYEGSAPADGGRRSSSSSRQDEFVVTSTGDERNWPENCAHCGARQMKKDYRLAAIKEDILRKLRLSSLPNITGRRLPDIPPLRNILDDQEMVNDPPANYDRYSYSEGDDDRATTVKMMLFHTPVPESNRTDAFKFNLPRDLSSHEIAKATLGVYVRRPQTRHHPSSGSSSQTFLLLYKPSGLPPRPGVAGPRVIVYRERLALNSADTGRWHQITMKSIVRQWIDDPESNFGLYFETADQYGKSLTVINPQSPDEEAFRPYLEIYVNEQTSTRSKRNLDLDCHEHSAEKRCCRYPLVVDFNDFGWDWVIVPRRYSAYYCAGECSFVYYQQNPHAHIVQQSHQAVSSSSSSRSSSSPTSGRGGSAVAAATGGPCCSPKKLSSISMLYYDEHMNIVYGRLPGMVVEQCGCS